MEEPMPILHLDDTDLYYEVHGTGQPFLFCSATSTWGEVWKFYQVPEFSRDHQVIIFDQRGTGRSPVRSSDFSTQRLAADAAALLDHLAVGPAIVLGHSNGGRVAQLLALDYPHKVDKLVLASSGGTHAARNRGISIDMCADLVEKGYERHLLDHVIEAGFTAAYHAAHPDEVKRFFEVRLGNLPSLRVYLGHVVGRQEYNSGDRLKSLNVPTLVLIGDDEDHGSLSGTTHFEFAQALARDIPGAKLVVLEGQRHYYYFSAPEETNKAIRNFLSG
jgi:pimeloyl-ACP methyl ester carboxylesterase